MNRVTCMREAASSRRLAQLLTAVALCAVVLAGCATAPPPAASGQRIGVLSLLGDQLQFADADGENPPTAFVDIGAWRIDDHVEDYVGQVIRRQGRFDVVDVGIDREVSQRIYAVCDGRCGSQAPDVRMDVLGRSLSRWRRDNGLERLIVLVRSDNRRALLGPLATSAAGVGLGVVPAQAGGGADAMVFAFVEVIVVEAETARVLATSAFFNNGFVDARLPTVDGGTWPAHGGQAFERAIRRQLEAGVDAALEQLGLLGP